MQDIFPELQQWTQAGNAHALATVIQTWGSAPRPLGSALAVSQTQELLGSVSGGCVEGAVIREALQALDQQQGKRLEFGIADADAWAVGLSCGGKLSVWVEPGLAYSPQPESQAIWHSLSKALDQNQGCVLIRDLDAEHPRHLLWLADGKVVGNLPDQLIPLAKEAYQQRKSQLIPQGDRTYFAQVFSRKSQLLILGATHITVELVELAQGFGFETIVVDPRGIFSEKTQFRLPPDQMHTAWPQEIFPNLTLDAYTYAVLLSHDPKIDDPALHSLLRADVAYIGALGGRKNQQKRRDRLQEAGFSETEIARIHGPVGLDIHAKSAREIALSILAQLIQVKNQYL